MNFTRLLILVFLMNSLGTIAQSYIGYDTDNYNGVHGVVTNPANISDARVKVDFNLISFSVMAANDYAGLSLDNLTQVIDGLIAANGLDFNGLNTFASNQNEILANADIMGPSFMLSLSEKHGVGLITRARMANNYNNISGALFEGLLDGFPDENFDFEQNKLDGTTHIWGEVGLSYGRVLFYDDDHHYLKAGATIKYLMGAGFAQGSSESLTGNFSAANRQLNLNGNFSYSTNINDDQEVTDYLDNYSAGIGMDVGVVYEFRTRNSRIGGANDNPRALNKYKVKVGLCLLDFGQIKYKDQQLDRYTIAGSVDANEVEADFIDALDNNFNKVSPKGNVTVALPTSLNLNLDYQVVWNVYANLDINQTLVKRDGLFNNNRLNQITFTPRFETRVISAYLPISYSALGKTAVGAGLKLGPFFVGSGSIISNITSNNPQMANVYLGFKMAINHRR
jgi:hypothetical protein